MKLRFTVEVTLDLPAAAVKKELKRVGGDLDMLAVGDFGELVLTTERYAKARVSSFVTGQYVEEIK